MNTFLCLLSIALIALPLADSAAYCTYHNYNSGDSLTTVACSDGANGVMTKFKYTNLSPMWPYVTAFSGATWNSPNCGRCVRLASGGRTVHLTVIDQCGPAPGGFDAHFDIAPPAFRELFGDAGVNAGVQRADWSFVDSSACRGNKGNTGGSPKPAPKPTPKPTPKPGPKPAPKPGSAKSNTRCGSNWADANGKCGTPCKTDAPCGGARCYADLSMAPCNRASGDDETTFSDNVEVESDFAVDAAVADTFDTDSDGNFVSDVAMNTEGESVDAAVADTSFETDSDGNFVSDVAMNTEETVDAAVAEEDNFVDNYVDSAMVDAAVADTSFETDSDGSFVANNDEQNFVDAAVAAETVPTVNTQQQTQSEASTGMQGWMVAILVMFSITTILLLAVIVLAVTMLRKH